MIFYLLNVFEYYATFIVLRIFSAVFIVENPKYLKYYYRYRIIVGLVNIELLFV